jgi:hypothetical protein
LDTEKEIGRGSKHEIDVYEEADGGDREFHNPNGEKKI